MKQSLTATSLKKKKSTSQKHISKAIHTRGQGCKIHLSPLSTEALASHVPSTEPVWLRGTTVACTNQGPTVVL